ncbi:SWIM zinc finger family protein [Streptomyces sp. NPDC085927]|uniref:SWIM zinc finger family protein n=1 Tax=Streptomyces sp. NPDC085927 TaxID=3365738 RepID=UPI0037D2AC12
MTPRPSDEAREALRAARRRAGTDPVPDAGEDGKPAGAREQRPGDVARDALRRAVRARRATDTGSPGTEDGEGDGDGHRAAGDVKADPGPETEGETATGHQGPATASAHGDAAAGTGVQAERRAGEPDGAVPPPAADGIRSRADHPDRPDPEPQPARRPGDIAREALRSARQEALRARTETDDRPSPERPSPEGPFPERSSDERSSHDRPSPGRSSAARATGDWRSDDRESTAGPRTGRVPSDTAPRVPRLPRTTRGDRATGVRAADARSGEEQVPEAGTPAVRDLLTGAVPSLPLPPAPSDAAEPSPKPDGPPHKPPTAHESSEPPTPLAAQGLPFPEAPPATPRTPRSMAAPTRDGELRRTFPAFPPRTEGGTGFADTWWGDAWVTALEEGALDAARLARGRGYAERGHVDAITVTPGLVLAYVQGSRPRPYRVQVRLRTFADAEWERFLDAAADRPGHIAALLDKEMPQSLADCGAPLLPGPGDLDPRCSCPDSGHPCKHAAALCYQTARLLDADPFVLLLLRGRGERDVIDALSRLSAARTARAARDREPEPLPAMRAGEAVAPRALPPLPAPLPPPPHPEQPPAYPAAPGGPDPFALDQLATDAAARAHALLTTGRDPVARLTLWQDAVRLAAARPGSGLTAATRALYSSLARATGRTPAELARAVAAWRQGGPAGLEALEDPWDPPAGRFDRARPLLLAADLPAFRPWHNHLTHPRGHLQLRLGRDHLWYAYESEPGQDDWWPRGTPDPDPVGALTGLDTPGTP